MRKLNKSQAYLARAKKVIPGCSQTFSKGPTQFVQGVSPSFLAYGKGAHVWDVDGNEYIDTILGLGPITLGYDYPRINEAVIDQTKKGAIFSQPHYLEVELAELIVDTIPGAEMVRFGKNGSDATTAAVRIARAYTGRDMIACCGYHGWQDWYIASTTRNLGIPKATGELTKTFEYNNIPSLERIFQEYPQKVAGVIMEPVGVVEPEDNFLSKVKELTHKRGALLIFDEIVTGFRVSLEGAQGYYQVTPDLAAFGKGCANGYPLSFVAGKKEVMQLGDKVFISFTFGGEVVSIRVAIETIKELKEKRVIEHMWKMGSKSKEGFNQLVKKHHLENYLQAKGLPVHFVHQFTPLEKATDSQGFTAGEEFDYLKLKSILHQEMVERGILTIGSNNFCYCHTEEDIAKILQVADEAMSIIAKALKDGNLDRYLKGKPVQPVFRRP